MKTELITLREGFEHGKSCFTQARVGLTPAEAVLTMQPLDLRGSDVYGRVHSSYAARPGFSFSTPLEQPDLHVGDFQTVDLYPQYHEQTGVLLSTGAGLHYVGDEPPKVDREAPLMTCYTTYRPETHDWTPARMLTEPDGTPVTAITAGCVQRADLADGTVLLPVCTGSRKTRMRVQILRCSFDGTTLTVRERSPEIAAEEEPRGLSEPSLIRYGERFFLTLRADSRGYVTVSEDGMHFAPLRPWCWDTGLEVPTYNTQQHWLSNTEGLFLVYTRRDGKNDHVFRNRAPLYMARVDTERICLLRDSERALTPERGARTGNFGVTRVNDRESWVVVAEWMQPLGCERYGSNNAVFLARVTADDGPA